MKRILIIEDDHDIAELVRRYLEKAGFAVEVTASGREGLATLTALRFLDPARPRRLAPRLRRLFGRAGLEREEVNILRGLLKALLK